MVGGLLAISIMTVARSRFFDRPRMTTRHQYRVILIPDQVCNTSIDEWWYILPKGLNSSNLESYPMDTANFDVHYLGGWHSWGSSFTWLTRYGEISTNLSPIETHIPMRFGNYLSGQSS